MRTITYWLSLVMIFAIPWQNIVNIQGLGTISRALGLSVAVLWVLLVVSTKGIRRPLPFHVVVFLFVLWHAASIFWSVNIDSTLKRSVTYLQLGVMVFILWDLFTTPASLKAGFQAYVWGAYVSIGSIVVNYLDGATVISQRFSAAGFNPNTVSMILVLGMPLAWHLTLSKGSNMKTWLLRLTNFMYLPAALFAISLTASRSAAATAGLVLLFILVSLRSLKPVLRVVIFVAVTTSLLVLPVFLPESSVNRIGDASTETTEGDMNGRLAIWMEGLEIFQEHPILGVGSGAFRTAAAGTRSAPHNFILSYLTEVGLIGLGLFFTILVMAVYHARFLPKWHSWMWLTILMIWLINAFFHNPESGKVTWLLLSLAVVNGSFFVGHRDTRPTPILPRFST